jgi:peptidyl-tRNA hydrolase, PTH1 family
MMPHQSKLVVGLGNPGREYEKTRHNIGSLIVEFLAQKFLLSFTKKTSLASIAKGVFQEREVVLAIPTTFMNESGRSVKQILAHEGIVPEHMAVVFDDVEKPFGKVSTIFNGGARGHNGLRSIHHELGTKSFLQVRIGVGRPLDGSVSDFVLSRFRGEELPFLEKIAEDAQKEIEDWIVRDSFQHLPGAERGE